MNITWDKGPPRNLRELYEFYHNYVKLHYAFVQAHNILPQATLFEFTAALDHLSRQWIYPGDAEKESVAVAKAYGHLKRACLDSFKLRLLIAGDQYKELSGIDTSALDNGEYNTKLHSLYNRIKAGGARARQMEGQPDENGGVPAFDVWIEVYRDCVELEQKFFQHSKLNWAKKRGRIKRIRALGGDVLVGVLVTLVVMVIVGDFPKEPKIPSSNGPVLSAPIEPNSTQIDTNKASQ